MRDHQNHSLKSHNTFGIEARCRRFLEYATVGEAQQVAGLLQQDATPYIIIGRGSNLLLTRDFDGTAVHSAILGIEQVDDCHIRCGSGEAWDDVVAWCVDHHLYGAENLSLIPGEVGASAVQNIGAYGVEVKDLIESVEAVEIATGQVRTFTNADCCYAYRDSRFKHDWKNRYLMTHVTYRLSTEEHLSLAYGNITSELERRGISYPTAAQLRSVIIDIRNAKLPDPQVTGNAGSFFMNPVVSREVFEKLLTDYPQMPHYYIDEQHEKIPAGWMIDQCGWKGRSLGRAGVHDKQALVLVNRGGATGDEIVTLCRTIQRDVKEKFGIDIYPEVNIV
jgi:UDP-N-acetylmuramate dehydrogenase